MIAQTKRQSSKKQESKVAKFIGGGVVSGSGSTPFFKGDVNHTYALIECKTCMETRKSVSIKKEWMEKIKKESFAMGKDLYALAFDFGGNETYFIIDQKAFTDYLNFLQQGGEA